MGLGMPEVVLILVIALIVFGPRKLPELGKSLGQAMSQFRKASDEFKRTWEQEVEFEKVRKGESPTAANQSSYDSNYHGDSSYGTDPDFNYNYGGVSESSSTDAPSAAESAAQSVTPAALPPAQTENVAAAPVVEKKPEPHWI
jgi:sec-independent protein translocase protein TatA